MKDKQRGQAIVIFALAGVVLLGLASIAVDGGISQANRRDIQATVDGAALAGARQYALGGDASGNASHFVAMEYLVRSFGLSVPGGCTVTACNDGPWPLGTSAVTQAACNGVTLWSYCFTFDDSRGFQNLDIRVSHSSTPLLAGALGITNETVGTGAGARPTGPLQIGSTYAVATLGGGSYTVKGGGTSVPSGNITGNVFSNSAFGGDNVSHLIHVPTLVAGVTSGGTVGACPGNVNTRVDFTPAGWTAEQASNAADHWEFAPTPAADPGTPTSTTASLPLAFDQDPPRSPTIVFTSAASPGARDINGNWNPGTYQNLIPDGGLGKLNGGVYHLTNSANPDLSTVIQKTPHASGTAADTDAVAFVLDKSDTGTLTLGSVVLNGFQNTNITGPDVDPEHTHNFVLYGGPSNTSDPTHSGFQGSITIASQDQPHVTGIIYLPNSSLTSKGTANYQFSGSVYMKDYTLAGGGNGDQGFRYICGLESISNIGSDGGLIR